MTCPGRHYVLETFSASGSFGDGEVRMTRFHPAGERLPLVVVFHGVHGCADPARGGGEWIDSAYRRTYLRLFELGWAHSVEVWHDGRLAGGLLGVEVGGLFCGETTFGLGTVAAVIVLGVLIYLLVRPYKESSDMEVKYNGK